MADIDLDAIVAQREEARAKEGDKPITFEFDGEKYEKTAGDTFTFGFQGADYAVRDPRYVTDEEQEQLEAVSGSIDVTCWYLGEEQFDKFIEAGGQSWMFMRVIEDFQKTIRDEAQGKPTRQNRSSRRSAARKPAKRR